MVIKADVLGYCFGVRRAVEKAEKALSEYKGHDVYSLGPLIHNETTLLRLQKAGLKVADEITDIPDNSVVIIRAHGVPPLVTKQLEEKSCTIIDATCPRVKGSQKIAAENAGDDFEIIFTGDREHGEVKGIAGYAGNNFHLIQNTADAEKTCEEIEDKIKNSGKRKKIILFSQTTFSEIEFEKIRVILENKFPETNVINTICPATKERQEALLELCRKVDGILVVGGKQSANTKRLYQTAK